MREQALQMLPFYLNGQLNEQDRAFVEQAMLQHPILRQELRFLEAVAGQVCESVTKVPESIGLGQVLARIEAEAHAKQSPSKLSQFFSALIGGAWMKPALIASVVGLGVQSWRVNDLNREAIQYRGNPTTAVGTQANVAYVNVSFQPSTSEAELRLLLAGINAQVVAGPSLSGEYRLALPADQFEQAKLSLQQSGLIVQITPASATP
jgi:hypothetical protein